MKAMILAAGRGKRMMPLTANTPKPLLKIKGLSIIEHNIKQLKANDFTNIIINTAHLGQKIEDKLGCGMQYGVQISYSRENTEALETAGGIINALPLLGHQPFLVLNGDTLNDYPLKKLHLPKHSLAHLILVPNPTHNPDGDFSLNVRGSTSYINHPNAVRSSISYTFSGVAIYHPDFFNDYPNTRLALSSLFKEGIKKQSISAEIHHGFWYDIGTPQRLNQLNQLNFNE